MNRSLRVLHVHSGNLYGGVETMLLAIAAHGPEDMQSSFALCFEGRFATEVRAAGASVAMLGETRVSRPWTVWRARRRLAALFDAVKPDVVVYHSGWSQAIFGPVARWRRLPAARWMHAPLDRTLWLERWAGRAPPSLFIANSRFTARSLAGVSRDSRHEVIYPPVPAPPADAAVPRARVRAAAGTDEQSVVIALVGRMESWKGHASLIHALAPMSARRDWTAWIVGGPQRHEEVAYLGALGVTAAQLGLGERVRFLGERTDVRQLLAAADLYCQPNTAAEPFGITFVEALYAGLPVVTYDLGGPSEIIDATCGVLVPAGNARELSVVLQRLCSEAGERRRLADAAPARARMLCEPGAQCRKVAEVLATLA